MVVLLPGVGRASTSNNECMPTAAATAAGPPQGWCSEAALWRSPPSPSPSVSPVFCFHNCRCWPAQVEPLRCRLFCRVHRAVAPLRSRCSEWIDGWRERGEGRDDFHDDEKGKGSKGNYLIESEKQFGDGRAPSPCLFASTLTCIFYSKLN